MGVVKTCKKHGNLTEDQVTRRKPPRTEIVCKQCNAERCKEYAAKNPDKMFKIRMHNRYIERDPNVTELKCTTCAKVKSVVDFNKYMLRIKYPSCIPCRRHATRLSKQKPQSKANHKHWYNTKYKPIAEDTRLRKLYSTSLEDYNNMLAQQNNVCAICKLPESTVSRLGNVIQLAIDHNHKTGALRGLLCFRCNRGIGMFKDNPAILMEVIKYLNLDLIK